MSYFSNFPVMLYDPSGDGSAKLTTNILKRVRVRAHMKKELVMLNQYEVLENETPEIVADKHHGDPSYHWVILLLNGIADVNHDWVKSTRQMQRYMSAKYSGNQLNEVHHYEVFQTSGDTTIKIEVENASYPSATSVTNYQYEIALNETKRKIDLLRNDLLPVFVEEFRNII
jgi:hypothetical protein